MSGAIGFVISVAVAVAAEAVEDSDWLATIVTLMSVLKAESLEALVSVLVAESLDALISVLVAESLDVLISVLMAESLDALIAAVGLDSIDSADDAGETEASDSENDDIPVISEDAIGVSKTVVRVVSVANRVVLIVRTSRSSASIVRT